MFGSPHPVHPIRGYQLLHQSLRRFCLFAAGSGGFEELQAAPRRAPRGGSRVDVFRAAS